MNHMERIKQSSSFQTLVNQYTEMHGWSGDKWHEDPDKLADAEIFAFEMMEYEDTCQSGDPIARKAVCS